MRETRERGKEGKRETKEKREGKMVRNREAKVGGGCQGTQRDVGRQICGADRGRDVRPERYSWGE